ncbi:dihydroorotase [Sporosalibacterium faouarense]|uniref:dihydroorotase n=1 Tax=Sporosalibacterium faouarense TaxID=516123 RepID=UPI00192C427E|nr:dihydroorotase [Sporosalibacterium faouarense]
MDMIIKGGTIVDCASDRLIKSDIYIKDQKIFEIDEEINEKGVEVIDAKGYFVIHGLVDAHVHFREPGYEYKETIKSGSLAAAKGGYTTVAVMPNTNPVIDSVEHLNLLKEIIKRDACINVLPIGAATIEEKGYQLTDIEKLFKNGIYGVSDDGQPIMDKKLMKEATITSNNLGIPIMIHSEDKRYVNNGCINEGKISDRLGVKGISRKAENNMIARDIELAKEFDLSVHICHVSTREAIEMIRNAKGSGVKVTCEVAPHHFSITEDIIIEKQSIGKVNPPLRTEADIQAIIEGIKDGTVDMIATDHAPHSKEEKLKDLEQAPFGLSGIELALPVTNINLLNKGIIDIFKMVRLLSINPSKLLGLKDRGIYKEGIADLAIIDLDSEYTLKEENLISKGKNTPYIGEKLKGKVKYTIVNGEIVYREDKQCL